MTSTDAVVRPAQDGEAGAIAWLAALTFPLACPPGTPASTVAAHVATHLTPQHVAHWIESPHHELLVAEAGAGPTGYALLVLGEPHGELEQQVLLEAAGPGPYVELSKIYVHPEHVGAGTASALMSSALLVADERAPGRPVWLGTNSENARTQAFYRKSGFAVVGRRSYDVGGVQHEDVVMLHTAGRD